MKTITAKDLKNRTGNALRTVARGEKVVVTLRGKPVALISPVTGDSNNLLSLRPAEDAWKDIEEALKQGAPHFKTARTAMRSTRRRP